MPGLVGLGHRTPPEGESVLRFSPLTLLNDKVCERHFAMNAWEYRNDLVSLEREMFVIVHLYSTVSVQRWTEPPRNGQFENMAKFGIIHPTMATQCTGLDCKLKPLHNTC